MLPKVELLAWINLRSKKNANKTIPHFETPVQSISTAPFIITDTNYTAHILDINCSVINCKKVHSYDPRFYYFKKQFFEIKKKENRLLCYNNNSNIVWRYEAPERIIDYKLTQNGLVVLNNEAIHYIDLNLGARDMGRPHYSQFLEF